MQPIGLPFDPLPGEEPPVNDLMYETLKEILTELREIKNLLAQQAILLTTLASQIN